MKFKSFFINIIQNRNFILILAFVMGLAIGNVGEWIKHLTVPALVIVMTVSFTRIPFRSFFPLKSIIKPIIWTIILNYFIFGAITLTLAWFLIPERQLWIGFVIVASAPPGVAIAPFTHVLNGNIKYSLAGVIGAYLASILIIPLFGIVFIGETFIQPLRLVIIFVEFIVIPIIISQILIRFKIERHIRKWAGTVVNWGLFLVIFSIIALNRDVFFTDFRSIILISIIALISIFGLGYTIEYILKKTSYKINTQKSLLLLGTIKNGGFAAATALVLFGGRASLPGAIVSVFLVLYLLLLSFRTKSNR